MINKIIFFQSHPIQYYSPLFKEMDKTIDMEVYYYSECGLIASYDSGFGKEVKWDIPLLDGYTYHFLKNFSVSKSMDCKWYNAINFSILNVIRKTSSKILVINGWSYFSDWLVLIAGVLFRKQIWVKADNPLSQEVKTGWKAKLKKLILKKLLFPCFDKFLYVGTESKLFFEYYGALPKQLVYTPHAVNNAWFQEYYNDKLHLKSTYREQCNVPKDSFVFLMCAKFISEKNHFDIINAFAKLKDQHCFLILVGDGPLKSNILAYITTHQIKNILLTGFVNQSEIAKYYQISDCFILTSSKETWGLAVNEAMNFALPIIISDACGCAFDLVEQGENGFIYPVGNISLLVKAMMSMMQDSDFVRRAALQSSKKINQYTYQTIITNIKHALE
jgi:glycosyltransferase involved in cell wall biosynthesis